MNDFRLMIGGYELKGLSSLILTRSIYALSAGLSLNVMLEDAAKISLGDPISCTAYGFRFEGFIDRILLTATGTSRLHKIEARSHPDAVDTSVENAQVFEQKRAEEILKSLVKKDKIQSNQAPLVPFFVVQGGESKLGAIQRLAKASGTLIYSDGSSLQLQNTTNLSAPDFLLGEDSGLEKVLFSQDMTRVFSEYRSQLYDDVSGSVRQAGVRERMLAFPPHLSPDMMTKYLHWEQTTREASMQTVEVGLQVKEEIPTLLTPVVLNLAELGIYGSFVISDQTLTLGSQSHNLTMKLQKLAAIKPNPTILDQQSAAGRLWS